MQTNSWTLDKGLRLQDGSGRQGGKMLAKSDLRTMKHLDGESYGTVMFGKLKYKH